MIKQLTHRTESPNYAQRRSCDMNLNMFKKKRKADEAFDYEYEYVYGIVTTEIIVGLLKDRKDKEKTTLIAKLDDNIRGIKQEQNAVNLSAQSYTSILKSPIHLITSQSFISPSMRGFQSNRIILIILLKRIMLTLYLRISIQYLRSNNIPSVVDQYDTTESKSLEDDRETNSFLDEVHKKKEKMLKNYI
ncbi:hypothetical protein GLOIN_2v1869260 [Rhizophagus clarus]|uniref:Uncharacterized protein n=1 Tax=Rhizophagus clarus TaxID=94130 RepID=A0A8H3L9C8_9GLOM|nr:hypothetical protein GLOIN_2v1869260 [Rhizophagus clarus]